MKHLFKILSLFLIALSCKAQSPVIDLHTTKKEIENAYYKDIENFYGQFVGTWVYTDNVKTIRYRFAKKDMFYYRSPTNYYVDFLVGEMQYIENGVEKINTLNRVDLNFDNIFKYSMSSIAKIGYDFAPLCPECPPDVKRLAMSYDEPTNDDFGLDATFVMRRVVEDGIEKLKVQYKSISGASGESKRDMSQPSTTTDFTIPYGDYTLVREN